MATPSDWANGYLQQALADMRAAERLQGHEPSVLAMLIQMVLEKLGKAALLRAGRISVAAARGSHAAATGMVQLLAMDPRACGRLGWRPDIVRSRVGPIVADLQRS